jgi:phosphoserine phosphatase
MKRFVLCAVAPAAVPAKLIHEVSLALEQIGLKRLAALPTAHERVWECEFEGEPVIDHRLVLQALSLVFKADLALIPQTAARTARRLVVFDMDSTLVAGEVIDEIARHAGMYDKVQAITARAMKGELDFTQSLHERVALLKGVSRASLKTVEHSIPLQPGVAHAAKILKRHNIHTAILTGGFTFFAETLRATLGFDEVFANNLVFTGDELAGTVSGEVVDGNAKARLMNEIAQRLGLTSDQVVAVGDGSNDLPMLTTAGLGVAFHAKEKVRRAASCEISQGTMQTLLCYMGLTKEAFDDV